MRKMSRPKGFRITILSMNMTNQKDYLTAVGRSTYAFMNMFCFCFYRLKCSLAQSKKKKGTPSLC